MKNLQKDIESCLEQILGVRVSSPTKTKIKSGAVVYRMAGNSDLRYDDNNNKVFVSKREKTPDGTYKQGHIEVTPEIFDTIRSSHYVGRWEVEMLWRGRERTRKELETALIQRGHAVEVRVGSGNGGYAASIAVEQLSKPVKPGDKFDAKMLAGEMIALGEALAPIQKTLDEVSLRLRALGIALTINLKE